MGMDLLPESALPLPKPNTKTYGGNAAFHNFNNDYSHIVNPNLRRRLALSEIDKIPFGWYHVRAVVVAGIGFFTDSYDIFAINLITAMLGMVFWQGAPSTGGNFGVLPTNINTAIKAATSGGAVIGQVGFGWLADVIGRRKMYGVELAIIILSTLAQTLSASSPATSMTGVFIFWRVVMGIGIGGDYPLSAVITSEFAPTRWRGGMMAAVFSMQGAGQFAAALVALITTVAFKDSFINTSRTFDSCDPGCQLAADRSWPDADVKAYINNYNEGEVDPILQQKTKVNQGHHLSQPSASWSDIAHYFRQWNHAKVLIGTTFSWFFLDLAYYGLGLNASTVLNAIGYGSGPTVYHVLLHTATGNLVLLRYSSTLAPTQRLLSYRANVFPLGIDPQVMVSVQQAEKIGAIIAQVISQPLLAKGASPHCEGAACSPWLNHLMQIFALFMLCGTMVSFLIQETKGRTLEELSGEANSSPDSIAPTGTSFCARNNPFTGGKPAGFSRNLKNITSPSLMPRSPGHRGKRERVGIMTSAEFLPNSHHDRSSSPRWSNRGHTRGGSDDTREVGADDYANGLHGDKRNVDLGGAGYGLNGGVLPGWGAGWQVQRGEVKKGERVESIQLMDVGKLLK
ncbi:hypothetical protein EYC84_002263 [Monilinia fructicola]|uniref:Major facilitator superfamily (MFS) profile domain-containing protein n=1 Tax=Monilinia fructicola TaxID=38448 RepID=A0A5M9JKC5_MONFR|nr:hypothetical protein EYC84_002263 [Monilinia fructicola]